MKGGGGCQEWSDVDMADIFWPRPNSSWRFTTKEPFLSLLCFNKQPIPRTPHPRFLKETSGMGSQEGMFFGGSRFTDDTAWVYEKPLKRKGILWNKYINRLFKAIMVPVSSTMVITRLRRKNWVNHTPSGIFRGGKYKFIRAGTRVPLYTLIGKVTIHS